MHLTDAEWSLICNALRGHARLVAESVREIEERSGKPLAPFIREGLMAQNEQEIALAEKIEAEVGV